MADLLALGVIAWMVVVIVLGAGLAWRLGVTPVLDGTGRSMLLLAAIVSAFCLGSTIIAWRLRPASTFVVAMASAGVVLVGAAVFTGSLSALVAVIALAVVAWLTGEALLSVLRVPSTPSLARVVLAFALGNGAFGMLLLLLGSLDRLDSGGLAVSVTLVTVVTGFIVLRRSGVSRVRRWRSHSASLGEAVLVGIASGLVAYALLTALLPEIASDATREHLPITRQIWETGSTAGLPWWTANQPIHGQLSSVIGWAAGGDVGVKLIHALVGLASLAAVAALAGMLAGRTAAVVGGVLFAAIPIIQWELGHAYVDLYPVLFCASAALAVVIWQEGGRVGALITGGALAGFAFAAKVVSAGPIASLGLALAVIGRARWRFRDRLAAVAAFALGGLVVLPWVYWSFEKTGSIPGLDYALNALFDQGSDLVGLWAGFGIGRDPLSIVSIPWVATFEGERFGEIGMGLLGILTLVTLPALIFVPRTRAVAFVASAALLAYLGWAYSAQYLRYALPALALVCALLGAGIAGLAVRLSSRYGGRSRNLLFGLLVVALAVTPFLSLNNWLFRVSPRYLAGQLSRETLLAENVLGYRVMDRASSLVGAGNPLEWVGLYDLPMIFTDAVPLGFEPPPPGTAAAEIVTRLKARGASHFAWDRNGTGLAAWRSPMLSLDFLREHTSVLYAADNAYLFEVFDEPMDRWGFGAEDLLSPLPSQSLDDSAWTSIGDVSTSGTSTVVKAGTTILHDVPVRGSSPYLLVAQAHCADPDDRLILVLSWTGRDGPVGLEWQLVVPGAEPSEQFLWAISPEEATGASVQISAFGDATCTIEDASLSPHV